MQFKHILVRNDLFNIVAVLFILRIEVRIDETQSPLMKLLDALSSGLKGEH